MHALIVTMLKVIASMAVGFLLYKLKILNTEVNKGISSLVVHVASPCLIFTSIVSMDASEKHNAITLLWLGFVLYAVIAIIAFIVVKIMKVQRKSSGVYQAALLFGNVGFIGLPLAQSLFGPVGCFYMALLNIHMNLLVYSYGFYLITREAEGKAKFTPKKLLNTGILCVVVAAPLYFMQVRIPDFIAQPIEFVGNMTSPLAMVVIGSTAAAFSLKKVFTQRDTYILAALKLIILPLLAFIVFRMIFGNNMMTQVLTIYVAMPTAAVVSMMANAYDADTEHAAYATAMMNILCVVTVPVVYIIMNYL